MGVVESVTAERIVIKASDGHSVSFTVTPGTRFFRGEKPARPDDVRAGERAVVQGKRAGERVEAVRVRLGATAESHRPLRTHRAASPREPNAITPRSRW